MMAVWIKVVALVLGLGALGGALALFGLPTNLTRNADAPAAVPAPPAGQAPTANTPVTPAQPAPAPSAAAPQAPAAAGQVAALPGAAPASEPIKAPMPAAPGMQAIPAPPTFDIVRVEPGGDAVIAGRAVPGSTVELLRNGQPHDRVKVDATGQFAMTPPKLQSGAHELTLAITTPDGKRQVSAQSVTVSVPTNPNGEVVVALTAPDKPTEILSRTPAANPAPNAPPGANPPAKLASAPAGPAAGATPSGPRSRVLLSTVEAEEGGKLFATGQAAPGAAVRLYLNETFLATAKAGPDGRWSFTINKGLEPGAYRVRVDDVDVDAKVLSRAEAPFDYTARMASLGNAGAVAAVSAPAAATAGAPGAGASSTATDASAQGGKPAQVASADSANVVVPEIRTTLVARGDSLWRISKKSYGSGMRYTVIYDANQTQIRDADLIYPGQMFVIPGDKKP